MNQGLIYYKIDNALDIYHESKYNDIMIVPSLNSYHYIKRLGGKAMALLHVNFFSDVLGKMTAMYVILPQKTSKQIGMNGAGTDGKYPVLYLLHGLSDDYTVWQRRTSIERYVAEMGIAVVMPDADTSFYSDMVYGRKYWTFLSQELPEIIHEFFPNISQRREDNFVAGLSMGGYGAYKLALGTDRFAAAASLSGALDLPLEMTNEDRIDANGDLWKNIFGDLSKVRDSINDPMYLASELVKSGKPLPKLYMWCGTEDFIYDLSVSAHKKLDELGFDLTYEESEGDHQWKYWDEKIQTVLKWLPY